MSYQPLTEHEFAQIRRNVMREIARRSHPGRWLALAAAAVIAVVVMMVPQSEHVRVPEPASVRQVSQSGAPAILPASPARSPALHEPAKRARRTTRTSSSAPVRMEFQTADPDIRIIWIAQ